MRRALVGTAAALAVIAAGAACSRTEGRERARRPVPGPSQSARPAATPTRSADRAVTDVERRAQPPTRGCVKGWIEPKRKTDLRSVPLRLLRESQGFDGEFTVVEMRYFRGPDDTNLAPDGTRTDVERWYGKVIYTKDKTFRLRFLVRRSAVGAGLVAIAPFGSRGFAADNWRGFEGDGTVSTFPGLPGRWPGRPVDYVATGELPPQVAGCLADSQ